MSSSSATTNGGAAVASYDDDPPPMPPVPPAANQGRTMTTKTVTIGQDGSLIVTKSDDGAIAMTGVPVPLHRRHSDDHPDPGSVFLGMALGAGGLWLIQRRRRGRERHRDALDAIGPQRGDADAADRARMAADVAALARRTATLETIVTDPAHRTAREIDALR